jgi:hypothetical protein
MPPKPRTPKTAASDRLRRSAAKKDDQETPTKRGATKVPHPTQRNQPEESDDSESDAPRPHVQYGYPGVPHPQQSESDTPRLYAQYGDLAAFRPQHGDLAALRRYSHT